MNRDFWPIQKNEDDFLFLFDVKYRRRRCELIYFSKRSKVGTIYRGNFDRDLRQIEITYPKKSIKWTLFCTFSTRDCVVIVYVLRNWENAGAVATCNRPDYSKPFSVRWKHNVNKLSFFPFQNQNNLSNMSKIYIYNFSSNNKKANLWNNVDNINFYFDSLFLIWID